MKKAGAKQAHICMEATNVYWEALAEYLHEQGYQVSVAGAFWAPMRTAGYARSQMQRNKDDPVDSAVICAFCATQQPALWQPPTPEQKAIRSLERHRDDLQKTLTQYKNRLATTRDASVRQAQMRLIELVQSEIAALDEQLQELIAQTPEAKEQFELLTSITSLGERSATKIIAEMYDLGSYKDAPAAAADAGVTPAKYESGDTVRKKTKLSKVGKATIRGVLYFPAMSAIRHNPIVRDLAERMRARGKSEMAIIGAAMHKLLHLAYGVLKHKTPFDPNYRRPLPAPA